MFQDLAKLIEVIGSLPTAVAFAVLAAIVLLTPSAVMVWLQLKQQKVQDALQKAQAALQAQTHAIATNHLHGLPEMAAALERIEKAIHEQNREQRAQTQTIRELLVAITVKLNDR